ncbi:SDR family NAD(P)-dependent oxidoreductase [Cellulomonas sp. JZ18]|uniref:SDR family NAD(P)-dependent oxidoreductase n=1 Tax=Cellulomonas sp. JZ18 TaxID=2654191 RepID=UPI0012D42885|nr:SDR family NAD(P)-dependent oxidoreductase [Cellulomonas sp. JZ18]QGQ20215.1 SDR family NAD(P)-dependent oxidoreductase [Cellulomonas sp. JZ18]
MGALDLRLQTTLVTGASAGIGAALSRALAARGSDLVLVARREERLHTLADELRRTHGVRVEVVAADLSAPRPGRTLAAEVARRGLRVTSLVNNAGFGLDGPFAAEDPDRLQQLVAVDVAAVVDVTRAFLPDLVAAGTGALVNVTSMAAYQPSPGMAAYAASKAFVLSLTEALWWETRGTGLRTLAFAPNLTRTEFFDEIGTEGYRGRYQTPDDVAAALVRALESGRDPGPSTTARRGDRALVALARLLGRRTALRAMARISGDRLLGAST